jgi:RelE-like HigB toxin of type II HigAB toxin-antitoxin system
LEKAIARSGQANEKGEGLSMRKGNAYRLVAAIDYRRGIVFIKWLGGHKALHIPAEVLIRLVRRRRQSR